jgi:hypothetical protein
MISCRIPYPIQREIQNPAPKGLRHHQMMKVIGGLLACHFNARAAFEIIRNMYDPSDFPDGEIEDALKWALERNNTKSTGQKLTTNRDQIRSPEEEIQNFLKEFRCSEADLWHASPWQPLEDWKLDSMLFIAGMYHAGEKINIVTEHHPESGSPRGYGLTSTRDEWLRCIRDKGTPEGKAGAWIRINPVDGKGISDANVTAYRFALVELDSIPAVLQIPLLAKLPLPINAILSSGGKSIHAWIRINAKDQSSYTRLTSKLYLLLARFGIDPSNKNPSRLSRLVGATRVIGASDEGKQKLLYLNPDNRSSKPIL